MARREISTYLRLLFCSLIIISYTVTTVESTADSHSYSNYTSLLNTVLSGYDTDVIPRDDHTKALEIDVTGYLHSLLDVDVILGQVTVLFALNARWTDSQMKWTPADYGGIADISLPKKRVWAPNFVLSTPVDFDMIGDTWMPVTFAANGSAETFLGDVIKSRCKFNMKFWPFDKHTCDIIFRVYGYASEDIRLTTTSGVDFHSATCPNDNAEWEITRSTTFAREHHGITTVVFRIEIKRLSGIFIILIVFPLYGLAFLSSFVFILPSEAGERIGMSTTLMLSLTVFLEVISDYIPNTSKPIPLLCVIVTLGVAMSILCTLMVIISFHFYNKHDEAMSVGGFFVTFVRVFNRRFRLSKVGTTVAIDNKNPSNKRHTNSSAEPTSNNVMDSSDARLRSLKHVNNCMTLSGMDAEFMKRSLSKDGVTADGGDVSGVDDMVDVCWKDVSFTIDKVCFVMSSVVHCVMIVIFTLYLTLGPNNE